MNSHRTPHAVPLSFLLAGVAALVLALGLGPVATARAATITVADGVVAVDGTDGACSLIEAIENANNGAATHADCTAGVAGADMIDLASNSTYTLTAAHNTTDGANGLPHISTVITINGNGSTIARSSAGGTPDFRIFHVWANGSSLTLNQLTLSNGRAVGNWPAGRGGAIYAQT